MGANDRLVAHRRVLLTVLVMTVIGGLIRVWSPAKLGLIHFDEGIYALAGLWPISPRGFWGIDPTVIAYAPGGYPFLIGTASYVLGFGDLTPILVSILMGTLTIPLVAWLSWRTFGPTAGAITATFAAFSGFHIALSRMALTDVSFLFFFILAIGLGQRFLERPNVLNTIGLGIGVGLAQWFKYHGWLTGAIVALTAVVNALLDPTERTPKRLARVWGQGACAALIALAVFWPWFSFVESHGGYADLLRHHASYMRGIGSWYPDLRLQLEDVMVLGQGSIKFAMVKAVVMFVTLYLVGIDWDRSKSIRERLLGPGVVIAAMGLICALSFGGLWGWGLGLPFLPFLFIVAPSQARVFGVWWLIFSVLTPFYHPYARLWLPLEACGWLLLGYLLSLNVATLPTNEAISTRMSRSLIWFTGTIVLVGVLLSASIPRVTYYAGENLPLVAPSDSLRIVCRQIQDQLPKDLARLRFLGRPSITFYLGTAGVSLSPQPDLDTLLKPGSANDWALVDDALLRQEPDHAQAKKRLTDGWEVVDRYPTGLNLPTLLDIYPGAARSKTEAATRDCPLWLIRPRVNGTK